MTNLEQLYTAIDLLLKQGLVPDDALMAKVAEREEELIKKEILPVVTEKIEPTLRQIKRDLTLVVDYVPGVPVRVRLSHEPGLYKEEDFVELTPDPQVFHGTHTIVSTSTHASPTGLRVIRKDGSVIQEKYAGDTLVVAIKEVGARKVRDLGIICCKIPLVSTTKDKKYGNAQVEVEPGLFVIKHSNNKMKKGYLERISKAFGLGWRIEII
jgi:hypothetical protein